MSKKKLPKGVPEENIYNKAHLLIEKAKKTII